MDPSVLVVLFLFSTVVLRVALVLLVVWLLLPRRLRCPHCGEATDGVVTPALARWLRLERRWCMACGWTGIAKRPYGSPVRSAAMGAETMMRIAALFALGTSGCASEEQILARAFGDESRWVDLTHPFNAQTVFWPTAEGFRLDTVAAGMTPAGYYYAAYNLHLAEHGGTHLDAPIHFAQGRNTTDQIPLSQLMGPAVVVDVAAKASPNPDYLVAVADLETFEAAHGRIPDGAIVLVRTGWGSRWPDRARYLGTDRTGPAAVPHLHFPGLDSSAARWIVANRRVDAVGIDTPSIDFGQSTGFHTHRILYGANIPGFENVANLDQLPTTGAYVIALPMKIEGGSGGPLRIVAVIP